MTNLSSQQLFLTEAAKALLDNQEQSLFLNLSQYQLWNISGSDSLQLMKLLVGDVAAKISPFQSLDFIFTGYQYSLLCLGKDSFRLGLYGELGTYGGLNFEETIHFAIATPDSLVASRLYSMNDTQMLHAQAQTGLRVSARRCDKMEEKEATAFCCVIALAESTAFDLLPKLAVVKPHKA
jgi:hypothetical protein